MLWPCVLPLQNWHLIKPFNLFYFILFSSYRFVLLGMWRNVYVLPKNRSNLLDVMEWKAKVVIIGFPFILSNCNSYYDIEKN